MSKHQKGFSVVEIIIVIVAVGLIGCAGWFVWQISSGKSVQKTSNVTQRPTLATSSSATMKKSETAEYKLPAAWQWYTGAGFKFAYPNAYGAFAVIESSIATDTVLASSKPQPPYIEGSTDSLYITITNSDAPFSTVKYGPTVKFVDGELIVQEVNPSDTVNEVDKPYRGFLKAEDVVRTNGQLTIYILNGGDEGTSYHKYAFELGDKTVIITLPGFYDGVSMMCPDTGCKENDKTAYEKFSNDLLESIAKL